MTGAVLVHGRAVADWWIGQVQHDGWIPRWDFDAPADDPVDTSAVRRAYQESGACR